jgi:hypothetical protein
MAEVKSAALLANNRSTWDTKARHSSVVRGLQVQMGFKGASRATRDASGIEPGGEISRAGNCKPLPVCTTGIGNRGMR